MMWRRHAVNRLMNIVGALHTDDTGDPPDGTPVRPEDQTNQAQIGAPEKRGATMIGKCQNSWTYHFPFPVKQPR
jgi:hypothetical protein